VRREGADRKLNCRTQENQITGLRRHHPSVPIEIDL
jgi:hypothetical protein